MTPPILISNIDVVDSFFPQPYTIVNERRNSPSPAMKNFEDLRAKNLLQTPRSISPVNSYQNYQGLNRSYSVSTTHNRRSPTLRPNPQVYSSQQKLNWQPRNSAGQPYMPSFQSDVNNNPVSISHQNKTTAKNEIAPKNPIFAVSVNSRPSPPPNQHHPQPIRNQLEMPENYPPITRRHTTNERMWNNKHRNISMTDQQIIANVYQMAQNPSLVSPKLERDQNHSNFGQNLNIGVTQNRCISRQAITPPPMNFYESENQNFIACRSPTPIVHQRSNSPRNLQWSTSNSTTLNKFTTDNLCFATDY